jgi:HD-GYP domain-containing protein (c-di-GMP phosphodiesterase class II)
MMKERPQPIYDLLEGIGFPWPVAEVACEHHDSIDGSGYPQGPSG